MSNDKLTQVKADYHETLAKIELIKAGVDIDKVDNLIKYIDTEEVDGIEQQAKAIAGDVKRDSSGVDPKVDKRVWKPFA